MKRVRVGWERSIERGSENAQAWRLRPYLWTDGESFNLYTLGVAPYRHQSHEFYSLPMIITSLTAYISSGLVGQIRYLVFYPPRSLSALYSLLTMSTNNRSEGRNVLIYDAKNPSEPVGGLILTHGITNANLYAMIDIICIFSSTFILQLEDSNTIILKNDDVLRPGNYYIVTTGEWAFYLVLE